MTIDDIRLRVGKIYAERGDDETAHREEDSFYRDFIEHIAKRKDALGTMAQEILKTKKIDFARWCG